jgi:hypothetical protein
MFIVWDKNVVEKLQNNYTVLELETFTKDQTEITAYCVLNEVSVAELPSLENSRKLHDSFVSEYKKGNYKFCVDAVEFLRGKFNGELDSFYDTILEKIAN